MLRPPSRRARGYVDRCSTMWPSSAPTSTPAPPSTTPCWRRSALAGSWTSARRSATARSSPTSGSGGTTTGDGFRESHIAFRAPDRDAVQAFFDAAVAARRRGAPRATGLAGVPPRLLRRLRARPRRQQRRGRPPHVLTAGSDRGAPARVVMASRSASSVARSAVEVDGLAVQRAGEAGRRARRRRRCAGTRRGGGRAAGRARPHGVRRTGRCSRTFIGTLGRFDSASFTATTASATSLNESSTGPACAQVDAADRGVRQVRSPRDLDARAERPGDGALDRRHVGDDGDRAVRRPARRARRTPRAHGRRAPASDSPPSGTNDGSARHCRHASDGTSACGTPS